MSTAGLHAVACESADELLTHVSSVDPMCVILDVSLPDASGLDIQERLTNVGAAILFLTRERCIPSCVRAIQAGATDFLTLPCEATKLLHALRTALQKATHTRSQRQLLGDLRTRFELLTRRERQVFELVCSGKMNKQIAEDLAITEFTVQVHRGRVMKKMRARSFAQLVRMEDSLNAGTTCAGATSNRNR